MCLVIVPILFVIIVTAKFIIETEEEAQVEICIEPNQKRYRPTVTRSNQCKFTSPAQLHFTDACSVTCSASIVNIQNPFAIVIVSAAFRVP